MEGFGVCDVLFPLPVPFPSLPILLPCSAALSSPFPFSPPIHFLSGTSKPAKPDRQISGYLCLRTGVEAKDTTHTRWERLTALEKRMCDLFKSKSGMWQVKQELYELVLHDLDAPFGRMEDIARQTQIRSELRGILTSVVEIIGVFPSGGEWGKHTAIDIRSRASLIAVSFSDLVRSTPRPFLKQLNGPIKCWRPLSEGEMTKRRKRRGLDSTKGAGKGKNGGGGGPRDPLSGSVVVPQRADAQRLSMLDFLLAAPPPPPPLLNAFSMAGLCS